MLAVNAGLLYGMLNGSSECWSVQGNAELYQVMLESSREW